MAVYELQSLSVFTPLYMCHTEPHYHSLMDTSKILHCTMAALQDCSRNLSSSPITCCRARKWEIQIKTTTTNLNKQVRLPCLSASEVRLQMTHRVIQRDDEQTSSFTGKGKDPALCAQGRAAFTELWVQHCRALCAGGQQAAHGDTAAPHLKYWLQQQMTLHLLWHPAALFERRQRFVALHIKHCQVMSVSWRLLSLLYLKAPNPITPESLHLKKTCLHSLDPENYPES